jgi:biotin transporter BioY
VPTGELLTRATIWLALLLYALGAVWWFNRHRLHAARLAWSVGLLAFIAHVLLAFHYFHAWSQSQALVETARQTEALTGLSSGSGLYLNYLFGIAWLAIILRWWFVTDALEAPPTLLDRAWHGFALFMIFNGTVVFGRGPIRWVGAAICGIVVLAWFRASRRAHRSTST